MYRKYSTYKLCRFSLLLLQDDISTLTEDRAYDRAASNSLFTQATIIAETETDVSDGYVFLFWNVLRSTCSLLKITSTQILGTSGTVYTRPLLLHMAPPPHMLLRAARPGYEARNA